MTFSIIDNLTGACPNPREIALEPWAIRLTGKISGFAIEEDGSLMRADRCGNVVYCPLGRFDIRDVHGLPDEFSSTGDPT
jgi:hypothetical protein